MTPPLAIILSGALIAIAILISSHWQITAAPMGTAPSAFIYRLDRWTGQVTVCTPGFAYIAKGCERVGFKE